MRKCMNLANCGPTLLASYDELAVMAESFMRPDSRPRGEVQDPVDFKRKCYLH